MRFKMDFSKLPKCGAKPKINSVRKHPCKHVALKNGRCYYHQGRPARHGYYSKAGRQAQRAATRAYIISAQSLLANIRSTINANGIE